MAVIKLDHIYIYIYKYPKMTQFILTLLPITILTSSVFVVTATSPVVSVLYVVALFLLTASYIMIVGLSFVGLVYLVVYVGAVAVLFLFVIMILNVPLSAYNTSDQVRSVPLVAILASLFMASFIVVQDTNTILIDTTNTNIITHSSFNQAQVLASELFSHDAVLLVIVGLVLLLAMIGPVSISIDHDVEGIRQLESSQ
jgi:NADH:ubiquinone oxidoreductase subunit 6 (subunit J)